MALFNVLHLCGIILLKGFGKGLKRKIAGCFDSFRKSLKNQGFWQKRRVSRSCWQKSQKFDKIVSGWMYYEKSQELDIFRSGEALKKFCLSENQNQRVWYAKHKSITISEDYDDPCGSYYWWNGLCFI